MDQTISSLLEQSETSLGATSYSGFSLINSLINSIHYTQSFLNSELGRIICNNDTQTDNAVKSAFDNLICLNSRVLEILDSLTPEKKLEIGKYVKNLYFGDFKHTISDDSYLNFYTFS